jgi:lysophospholipase L1-like esterase
MNRWQGLRFVVTAVSMVMPGVGFGADGGAVSVDAGKVSVTAVSRMDQKWWADRHAAKLALVQQGGWDLVFIGDSITQGWEGAGRAAWDAHYGSRKALNLGYSGDRTEHVLWRIANGELDGLKPKVVVMMIGTNNGGHRKGETPEAIADGIKAIIGGLQAKCPETRLLLLGIFPRAEAASAMRVRNDRANALIAKFADGDKVVFLDINKTFLTDAGEIPREIMPDLLHPKEKGYGLWAEAMEPELRRLLGEKTP